MTLTDRGGTPALVVNAKALKKGRCKGNDTERKDSDAQADCAEQRPQTAGVEAERGKGGVRFFVIARFYVRGKDWKTYQKEFNNLEAAETWAEEMYNSAHLDRGEEVTVCLYELKKSYN